MRRITPQFLKQRFPDYNAWKFGEHSIYGYSEKLKEWLIIIGGMKEDTVWTCISYMCVSGEVAIELLLSGGLIPYKNKNEYSGELKFIITEEEINEYTDHPRVDSIISEIKNLEESKRADLFRQLTEML